MEICRVFSYGKIIRTSRKLWSKIKIGNYEEIMNKMEFRWPQRDKNEKKWWKIHDKMNGTSVNTEKTNIYFRKWINNEDVNEVRMKF